LLLACQAEGRQGLCSATVAFFLFILFNNRLEQRDLRIYEADLCQILRVGRHAAVSVRSGICFAIAQGTLSWQLILGTKSTKIGETPSILGRAFHNRLQDAKVDGRINTPDVLSACIKIW